MKRNLHLIALANAGVPLSGLHQIVQVLAHCGTVGPENDPGQLRVRLPELRGQDNLGVREVHLVARQEGARFFER